MQSYRLSRWVFIFVGSGPLIGTKEKNVPPASVVGAFAFCGLSVARPGLGSGGIGGSGGMIAAAAAAAAGGCRWLGESEVAP